MTRDDAARMLMVTYSDPHWIRSGKADDLLRSFANEPGARLTLLGGRDLDDPYRHTRGKTMRKASMLVQLHRLLSECTPPAPETCVLFSDADVVWLTGFWRKLQAACDNWPSAFPRGGPSRAPLSRERLLRHQGTCRMAPPPLAHRCRSGWR